jgi:hypothetical protein
MYGQKSSQTITHIVVELKCISETCMWSTPMMKAAILRTKI